MKTQSRTSKFITGVASVCALTIATTASAKNPKSVLLEISDNKLIMITTKDENDCKVTFGQFRNKGCIQLKHKEKSEIYFQLKENSKCTLDSGTKWELNAVYLGGFNSSSNPTDEGAYGFESISDDDYAMVNSDFNIADRKTGLVTSTEKKPKKITINDNNAYEYIVWYKVEAICEREDGGTAHTIYYDPRIKNGGTQ